jgi:glutathione S-transferase
VKHTTTPGSISIGLIAKRVANTYGDLRRDQVVERMAWLDKELEGREFIGVDRYNIADITAQVALLTARGALQLRIPEEHRNLTRGWKAVTARPSARA